jgi:hypothetical protein
MSFFNKTDCRMQGNSYFAAANTQNGFVSFFDRIFTDVKRIYVIKAGPGTGKSTLMAKIAAEGENRGLEVQKFYCSSDTSSLDGVIVKDKFAVIDATLPHVFEPKLPGVRDLIVDLYPTWNTEALEKHQSEICELNKKISSAYAHVYRLLNAMGTLEEEYFSTLKPHVNKEKLKKFTDRIAKYAKSKGQPTLRLTDALGTDGFVHFSTFEMRASKTVYLKGRHHEEYFLIRELIKSLNEMNVGYSYSLSPVTLEPCSVLIGNALAFVSVDHVPKEVCAYNTARFLNDGIKAAKPRLKELEREIRDISEIITEDLTHVGVLHGELEEYYKHAVDYQKLDMLTKKLLIKLFCDK